MPTVLHHPRTKIIRQICRQHPIIISLIVTLRPLQHLIHRHSKLRTTRRRHDLGNVGVVVQLFPRLCVEFLGGFAGAGWVAEGLDFVRAAGGFLAAEVCEAVFLDEVDLQGADGFDVAVGEGVCVPGLGPAVFVAVQEDDCCGEVVVVFDDVLEVGETFAAFVNGGVARGEGVIDGVDYVAPSAITFPYIRFVPF